MGCCSSLCPAGDDGTDDERVPLQPRTSSFREAEENVPNRAQYYQSVVDDARKKFITPASRNGRFEKNSDDYSKIKVDLEAAISSSTCKLEDSPNQLRKASAGGGSSTIANTDNSQRKSVPEILKEPLNSEYDETVADEMAEIVSKHTYNMTVDDNAVSVVVLKPGGLQLGDPAPTNSSAPQVPA